MAKQAAAAASPFEHTEKLRKRQIGMLETVKRQAGPLVGMMPSANMRDRARKIYDLAKELQDDLAK